MHGKKMAVLAYKYNPDRRHLIENALSVTSVITFQNDEKALQHELNKNQYDIILVDVCHGKDRELDLLEKIVDFTSFIPLIVTCDSEDNDLIDEMFDTRVHAVLSHPFSPATIKRVVRRALQKKQQDNELAYLRREQDIVYNFDRIIAENDNFKAIINSLRRFAATDATILITGNTGTGKSFLSGTVHYNSPRRDHPFIKINCANIPEALLESELFGHEKGSFTGADKQRIGRFEQADGGTIFLDEIGEISLEIQSKLLRVLEEKSFERVGGNKTIKVDVRLIVATNRNLAVQITAGKFREDLFYRINILPVHLPPLKDRPRCLIPLAQGLLKKATASMKKGHIKGFSPEVLTVIQGYDWPGNIRQLANTIERAVILEDGERICLQSLHIPELGPTASSLIQVTEPLETHERELIYKALNENLWVQKNAASCLGISPRALNYKIKKFGITHQNWRKHKKE
jgi:DNA-binding NtrC family response regulator